MNSKSLQHVMFAASLFVIGGVVAVGEEPRTAALIQVEEDFTTDPGWEGLHNRVVATDGPTVTQDFGYESGQVGGTVACSTTPASYGMRVGPFSFEDALSASGKIRLHRAPSRSGLYVGFYNAARQGWRPWSALMVQLSGSQRGESVRRENVEGAQVWFSTVSASWQADAMVTDWVIPADGTEHTWSFRYDPEARIDLNWPHPGLQKLFRDSRYDEGQLFAMARQAEPDLKRAELRRRLEAAADQGLIIYDPRRGTDYWELQRDAEKYRGCITFQVDDEKPRRMFLSPGHREEPLVLDRFGVVNQQTSGRALEFALTDLVVNGHAIDLTDDPGWEGRGNRITFRERDFHSRQDFGFSETNWAGKGPGEVGGVFWRVEPVDPLLGYYAADVRTLTLEDPIRVSGSISFVEGQPDSGVGFGYFNQEEFTAKITDEAAGHPLPGMLGIVIDGPTRVGYYFSGLISPTRELATNAQGPKFEPERSKHVFQFTYDPEANAGVGRLTVRLDDQEFHRDLTPSQRKAGARFDRFGFWTLRRGGKFVEVYLDDLSYTTRRPKDKGKPHPDEVVKVPYPEGGRKY